MELKTYRKYGLKIHTNVTLLGSEFEKVTFEMEKRPCALCNICKQGFMRKDVGFSEIFEFMSKNDGFTDYLNSLND